MNKILFKEKGKYDSKTRRKKKSVNRHRSKNDKGDRIRNKNFETVIIRHIRLKKFQIVIVQFEKYCMWYANFTGNLTTDKHHRRKTISELNYHTKSQSTNKSHQ